MKIAFLACDTTLPGTANRRADAFEHDYQFDAIRKPLAEKGVSLEEINWKAPLEDIVQYDLALISTTWDYQDCCDAFLSKLEAIEARGVALHNPSKLVRWNIEKTYLRDLGDKGAPTVPTLWVETPTADDARRAFSQFNADTIVIKRQVGAGAEGQKKLDKNDALPDGPLLDRPAMIQPFLPAIRSEGEYSFIFVDGELSHALVKRAKAGDYRIQSAYGGKEEAVTPSTSDLGQALDIVQSLPGGAPLYARIDMVRSNSGDLLLMEAELVEPYLYPVEGPDLGSKMANALMARLA